jgi:hypothetical protein
MADSKRPTWSGSAVVDAPVGEVWKALVDSLKKSGVGTVTVDEAERRVSLGGGWWYRGEHVVKPHEGGSVIQYQVFNVASGATRWLVPFVLKGGTGKLRDDFQGLLKNLGKTLHASVRYRGK